MSRPFGEWPLLCLLSHWRLRRVFSAASSFSRSEEDVICCCCSTAPVVELRFIQAEFASGGSENQYAQPVSAPHRGIRVCTVYGRFAVDAGFVTSNQLWLRVYSLRRVSTNVVGSTHPHRDHNYIDKGIVIMIAINLFQATTKLKRQTTHSAMRPWLCDPHSRLPPHSGITLKAVG